MASSSAWRWVPKPKTFLGLISLQNGTEIITLTLIFNKLTGLYGLLAILTGYSLSLLQFSMYIYSLSLLIILAVVLPHIRKQSPFELLSLAWIYGIDTILNAAYTTAFAINWFAKSAALTDRHPDPYGADDTESSATENNAVPDVTLAKGTPVTPDVPKTTKHIGPEESWTSLALVIVVTIVRVYFALVVMSFAQQVLSGQRDEKGWEPESHRPDDEVFAVGTPEGQGWRGRVGRVMLNTGKPYWLSGGDRSQDGWSKNVSSKFRNAAAQA